MTDVRSQWYLYKTFFMLSSAVHENVSANKYEKLAFSYLLAEIILCSAMFNKNEFRPIFRVWLNNVKHCSAKHEK